MKTTIKEKLSGREIEILGDMVAAMKACVSRNAAFRQSNMRGEWRLAMDFHLHPDEYPIAIRKIEEKIKPKA